MRCFELRDRFGLQAGIHWNVGDFVGLVDRRGFRLLLIGAVGWL